MGADATGGRKEFASGAAGDPRLTQLQWGYPVNLKSFIKMRRTVLAAAALVACVGIASADAGAVQVGGQVDGAAVSAQPGNAGNPYSPEYGHPYRHGALPTRGVHAQMKQWEAMHSTSGAAPGQVPGIAAATGTQTLSYGGANNGVGVLSGQSKVYLVFYGSQWGTQGTDCQWQLRRSPAIRTVPLRSRR